MSSTIGDASLSNIDHITWLERAVCSNFACCSTVLRDLHALIEHYEENHIPVQSQDGKPVFLVNVLRNLSVCTPPPSLINTPSSSRSPSVLSSPTTPCSSLSYPIKIALQTCEVGASPYPNEDIYRPFPSNSKAVYSPFACLSHDDALGSDVAVDFLDYGIGVENYDEELTAPSMLDLYSDETPETLPSSIIRHHEFNDVPAALEPLSTNLVHEREREANTNHKVELGNSSDASGSSSRKSMKGGKSRPRAMGPGYNFSHGRKRERTFRCPTKGCTKIYLNPNGLKYHMEKGTCKIEDVPASLNVGTSSPKQAKVAVAEEEEGAVNSTPKTRQAPLSVAAASRNVLSMQDYGHNLVPYDTATSSTDHIRTDSDSLSEVVPDGVRAPTLPPSAVCATLSVLSNTSVTSAV